MRIINMGATNLHLLQELSEILKKQKTSTLPSSLSSVLERVVFSMDILEIGPWEALEVKRKATSCEIKETGINSEYIRKAIRNTGHNPTNSTEDIFLMKNGLEWADCLEDTNPTWVGKYYQAGLFLTPVCARNISVHAVFKGPQILSIYGFNFDRFFETRATDSSMQMTIERNLALGVHQMIGDSFAQTLSKKDMITNSYLTSQVYADMPKTKFAYSLARIFNADGWCLDFTDEKRLSAGIKQENKGKFDDLYMEFTCNTDLNTFLTYMLYQDGDIFKVTDHMDYLEMTASKPTNGEIDETWISDLPFADILKDEDLTEKYLDIGEQMRDWYNSAVNEVPAENQNMEWLFKKHMLLPGNTSIRYSIVHHIKDEVLRRDPLEYMFSTISEIQVVPGVITDDTLPYPLYESYKTAVGVLKKFLK